MNTSLLIFHNILLTIAVLYLSVWGIQLIIASIDRGLLYNWVFVTFAVLLIAALITGCVITWLVTLI